MQQGYIKLHRQIQDSKVWKIKPYSLGQAWVDLLISANHKPGCIWVRGIPIDIHAGQVGHSVKTLAGRWGWSRGKVNRFLQWLESEHQIEHQKTNISTVITITNWSTYQETDSKTDTRRTPDGHQTDTNKNEKNVKNGKKKNKYGEFVLLTPDEHRLLVERFGAVGTAERLEGLNNYIGSKGRRYKSHYHTILAWERNNGQKKQEPVRNHHAKQSEYGVTIAND